MTRTNCPTGSQAPRCLDWASCLRLHHQRNLSCSHSTTPSSSPLFVSGFSPTLMTRCEHVRAALREYDVDRMPVVSWRYSFEMETTGQSLAEAMTGFQSRFYGDFMKAPYRRAGTSSRSRVKRNGIIVCTSSG
jgi:hypothetical protein